MAKVQISIDDELMERVDSFADDNYMSRSQVFSLSVTRYINENAAFKAIQDMSFTMRKIADIGGVDEETMRELEDFHRFAQVLVGK